MNPERIERITDHVSVDALAQVRLPSMINALIARTNAGNGAPAAAGRFIERLMHSC